MILFKSSGTGLDESEKVAEDDDMPPISKDEIKKRMIELAKMRSKLHYQEKKALVHSETCSDID